MRIRSLVVLWMLTVSRFVVADADPPPAGSFTRVVLPDTQYYTDADPALGRPYSPKKAVEALYRPETGSPGDTVSVPLTSTLATLRRADRLVFGSFWGVEPSASPTARLYARPAADMRPPPTGGPSGSAAAAVGRSRIDRLREAGATSAPRTVAAPPPSRCGR